MDFSPNYLGPSPKRPKLTIPPHKLQSTTKASNLSSQNHITYEESKTLYIQNNKMHHTRWLIILLSLILSTTRFWW